MNPADTSAHDILDSVEALRARTRAARPRMSIPLLLVAILMLGAMPLYVLRPLDDTTWRPSSRFSSLAGFSGVNSPDVAASYWIVGVPLCYAMVVAYFAWSSTRSGVKMRTRTWVISGTLLSIATLIAVYASGSMRIAGTVFGRGLVPLLTVTVAVLIWGLSVRSISLTVAGAIGLAASLVANLYNVENLLPAGSVDYRYNLIVNIALPTVVFLVAAAAVAVTRERSRR